MFDRLLDASVLFSFDRSGFRRHSLAFREGELDVDLSGKTCLVTGANSGIGLETAAALWARGADVVLGCRNAARARAVAERLEREGRRPKIALIDVADPASVADFLGDWSRPVDVLVHNAGVLPRTLEWVGDVEVTAATHLRGPHQLTRQLPFAEGARVIWVSSGGMYSQRLDVAAIVAPPEPYKGVTAYARTKRAQVVLAELWAERLAPRGIRVAAMHPGWADTPSVRSSIPTFYRVTRSILRTPAEGADTVVWLAATPHAWPTGRFWFDRREVPTHLLPWTRDTEAERARLWAWCDQV